MLRHKEKNTRKLFAAIATVAGLAMTVPAMAATTQTCVAPKFQHNGILSTVKDLKKVKAHIDAGDAAWVSAFNNLKKSPLASLTYTPRPFAIVSSGISNSAAQGTSEEGYDSKAAYAQALMWVYTGDVRYAKNAAKILDAWSSTLKTHQGANWYLQASWMGSTFPLSAELLRATYPGWTAAESAQFSNMLNTAFLPLLHNRMAWGNREFSTINALMAIGVYNEDAAAFCEGLTHWQSYVPDFIYMSTDGAPKRATFYLTAPSDDTLLALNSKLFPKGGNWITAAKSVTNYGDDTTILTKWTAAQQWYNPGGQLKDGYSSETGRDLSHAELAMAGILHSAEIAWNQGIDVYTPNAARLAAFMEVHAGFRLGDTMPSTLYGGVLNWYNVMYPTYQVGYTHLHGTLGIAMPNTRKINKKYANVVPGEWQTAPDGLQAKVVWGQASLLSSWTAVTSTNVD